MGTKALGRSLRRLLLAAGSALAATSGHAQTAPQGVKPAYGDISPFYGDLRPFYGDISPFYGDLRPFYGDLRPFWGDNSAFWGDVGAFSGDLSGFWGTLQPTGTNPAYADVVKFWGQTGPQMETTFANWRAASSTSDFVAVRDQLRQLVGGSAGFWGSAVQARTGQTFNDAFAAPLLNKWGVDLSNPNSLSKLDPSAQAGFFLAFYDGLMDYAGVDHVDYWMKLADWSPALTQTQGSGSRTTIGLLDLTVAGDTVIQKNIVAYDGVSNFTNGHGAAVASLMVAAHDGRGVMGIAPQASVIAYNPFDSTGTASWADITSGVAMLTSNHASVVNMSLGVPGYTLPAEWNQVFSSQAVAPAAKNTVFVLAAGNEGVSQSGTIAWNFQVDPQIIVVGSVGVTGTISNFSNRPGSACLADNSGCKTALMNRFVVAPGELILVSDDHGGVTRQTGTSLAAPLVSGAVALLQTRWPWLVNYPHETTQIILQSARDLGAPGPDPVYGMGLLDIKASQSPLDFNNLVWYTIDAKGQPRQQTRASVLNTYQNVQQQAWDVRNAYFFAYEKIGATQRDFAVPLSQKLIGQTVNSLSGPQLFQAYLLAEMTDWASAQTGQNSAPRFSQARSYALANPWGADLRLSMAPRQARFGFVQDARSVDTALELHGQASRLAFGVGSGAALVANQPGFTSSGDFDETRSGVNPFVSLASGGAFAAWSWRPSERLELSFGATDRHDRRDGAIPGADRADSGTRIYDASATTLGATFHPSERLDLALTYTRLHEASGFLGVQSLDPADLSGGSSTEGASLGFAWRPSGELTLAASGTLGRTRSDGGSANLKADGVSSAAWQVSVERAGLFGKHDKLKLSALQPLSVTGGAIRWRDVEVVDRTTGELGVVSHSYGLGGARAPLGEVSYARPFLGGRAEASLIGRFELSGQRPAQGASDTTALARFRLSF